MGDELDKEETERLETSEENARPWWKRMKVEKGNVKDPFGRETRGMKFSVKGDGFLHEVIQAVRGWFR